MLTRARPQPRPVTPRIAPPSRFPLAWAAALGGGLLVAASAAAQDPRPAPAGRGLESVATLTDTLYRHALHDSIQAILKPLIARAEKNGDREAVLWLQRRRAELMILRGDAAAGLVVADRVQQLAESAHDTLIILDALRWRDFALQQLGRYDEAERTATRSLALARLARQPYYVGRARISFAWFASRAGDYRRSLEEYRLAADTLLLVDRPADAAFAWLGGGQAAFDTGDRELARSMNERALSFARRLGLPRFEAHALGNLAQIEIVTGDPAAAMRNYRLCYQTFRRLGIWNVALYPATDLAITLATLGRFDEAIALADTMLRDCQTHGYRDQLPMVYGVLGRVRLIQGRPREAAAALRRALERSDVGEADVLSHAVEGLVRSLIRSDSLAAALRVLETRGPRAAARGARHRSAELTAMRGECLLGLDRPAEADAEFERAGRQAEAQSIAGLAAETWLGSARARRALGDTSGARAALARAERQWERDRAVPTDAEWREQHGARGRAIAEQALELELGEGAPPPARVRAAFDRLQRYKSRTLLERLRGSLSAPEDSAAFAPVTLAALQHQILQPGELLLDFFAGERTVVLFAVSRDSVQLGRLPAEALREPLALFRDLVRRPPTPGADAQGLARRAARKLGRQLLGPAQDLVSGSGRLLVAADGVLHLVPFGSLEIDQGGRPRVLIESHEVASVVSATLLARLRSRSARPASAGLLAVSGAASENFRGVEREIQELRGSFRNVTTVAGQADSAVLAELPRYQVLHFAGHSDVDDQHPWQSPVPGLRDARGPLTAEKIAVLRLNARLAVLSSCESGGGRVLSGEGVAGLSTAFLSAGVPAVAASLWPVDDRATARFMAWFYDELARGRPVAAALAAAQNRARREPRMAHPFFWAAFVLVGDPSAAVRLEANPLSPRRAGSYAALVALAMAGAWWLSFRVAGRRQPRP